MDGRGDGLEGGELARERVAARAEEQAGKRVGLAADGAGVAVRVRGVAPSRERRSAERDRRAVGRAVEAHAGARAREDHALRVPREAPDARAVVPVAPESAAAAGVPEHEFALVAPGRDEAAVRAPGERARDAREG